MKAILEFNLPEDDVEYNMASSAIKMHSVLWQLDQYLRSIVKYGVSDPLSGDDKIDQIAAASIREHLHLLLSEQGITI